MNNDSQTKRQGERDIERLLQAAGGRKQPPSDMKARVYAATESVWRELPEPTEQGASGSNSFFGWQPAAIAAGLVLVVGAAMIALFLQPSAVVSDPSVGRVAFAPSGVELNGEQRAGDTQLLAGDRLRAPAHGHVSIRLRGGARLAMAPSARVQVDAERTVHLLAGKAYFDIQGEEARVRVVTPHMQVVDIGTQFLVEVAGDDTRVAVREGQVEITTEGAQHQGRAVEGEGDLLTFTRADLQSVAQVGVQDSMWDWTQSARPALHLEGTTVFEYLSWMARDTGHEVAYASRSVELLARGDQVLTGASLTSEDATIEEVLEATRFVISDPQARVWAVEFRR